MLQVHWVLYDSYDREAFLRLLEYYLEHPLEAQAIARAGQAYALQHHRTVSRMDQLLWTAVLNKTRTMDLGPLVRKRA